MADFFQTRMGQKFYEADVPRIAKALERIADALEAQNRSAPSVCPHCKEQPATHKLDPFSGQAVCEPCHKALREEWDSRRPR